MLHAVKYDFVVKPILNSKYFVQRGKDGIGILTSSDTNDGSVDVWYKDALLDRIVCAFTPPSSGDGAIVGLGRVFAFWFD